MTAIGCEILNSLHALEPAKITVKLGEKWGFKVSLESLQGFGLELKNEIRVSLSAAVNVFRVLSIHR
ncbi:protein of unknown function [Methylocaldum szegediense]|uniref:Uncharacterized protein n=1 Tax=Methylocaldum szegediense TaxID=73780 RepID=A0ABN8XBA6_9GAMM|nr:protein of unknown function [Methylocaldum szegediense]